ncbi:FecR family protein [Solitalea lacus]|uniref:FecR family protein n=1 Tax=Solitalea lacus TaxID=2911172 RepID=UPI001EDB02DB|nr:FecR domain-containing protein [Solitalea lacus]UKJ06807.1 DUF4974 domain-containing protein [Solitalea lacus]
MEDLKGKALIRKYLNGECSPSEKAIIEKWYLDLAQQEQQDIAELDYEKIEAEIWSHLPKSPQKEKRIIRLWQRYTAAAVVLLLLSTSIYFFARESNNPQITSNSKEILPGGNKATLTLSDGSIVVLSDHLNGAIENRDNVKIMKMQEGVLSYDKIDGNENVSSALNTLSTPYGGTYQIGLSDGTKVWLNSGSSLKYPTKFTGNERLVELTGEAYFEVAHNKEKPFKVTSNGQVVQVLGTHFNINAYLDDATVKTTLLEGSVRVSSLRSNNKLQKETILKPGQQSQINQINGDIKVEPADLEEAVAWKNGDFVFRQQPLTQILTTLSRWYSVEIKYETDQLSKQTFSGVISRSRNLSAVLEMLESTGQINFEIQDNKIVVKNK